jgi:glutathione S-transferase
VRAMIKVSAFRWVPPFAQGLVRDFRVRWALEEAGLPYEIKLIGREDQSSPSYRALQPFGQVPSFEEDGLTMFESGAILLHIAQRSEALMPADAADRAHVMMWVFAALNTIEPHVLNLVILEASDADEATKAARRPSLVAMATKRLTDLGKALEGRDYLVANRFTAADLMTSAVLRILRTTDLVAKVPAVDAYFKRCLARPAFEKAVADQLAVFAANTPAKT